MKKLNKEQTIAVVNCMLEYAEKEHKTFKPGYPCKASLMRWYTHQLRGNRIDGMMFVNDKLFVNVSRHDVHGCVEIPADGSYLRFIANSWYDHQLTF